MTILCKIFGHQVHHTKELGWHCRRCGRNLYNQVLEITRAEKRKSREREQRRLHPNRFARQK